MTGIVESNPFIVSPIGSRRLAAGSNAIVLDVKTGNVAFVKTQDRATILAQARSNWVAVWGDA